MYVLSVLGVIRGMLQVFRMDVVKVDHDVTYVASVSEACRKCFRGMLQAFVQNVLDVCCKRFYLNVAHVSHMLQGYVFNVSVLCCNKCFHVVSCKCFI